MFEPITCLDRAAAPCWEWRWATPWRRTAGRSGAQQIRSCYKQVVDYVDGARAWRDKPFRWRSPGLYSDDTQQALILADVLVERGRIDQERIVELYRALATPREGHVGAYRGIGRTLREVIQEWEARHVADFGGARLGGHQRRGTDRAVGDLLRRSA